MRLPIWSCSVRGLACHRCCHRRGALLPHLFTLTHIVPVHPACTPRTRCTWRSGAACESAPRTPQDQPERCERYIFCATFLQVALTGDYPAHCPAEFGLSSPPSPCGFGAAVAWLTATIYSTGTGRTGRTGRTGQKDFPTCPTRPTCPNLVPPVLLLPRRRSEPRVIRAVRSSPSTSSMTSATITPDFSRPWMCAIFG
jgi:hypothetical protein